MSWLMKLKKKALRTRSFASLSYADSFEGQRNYSFDAFAKKTVEEKRGANFANIALSSSVSEDRIEGDLLNKITTLKCLETQIRSFEERFNKRHGYPPATDEDKKPSHATYILYAGLKIKVHRDAATKIQSCYRGGRVRWNLMCMSDPRLMSLATERVVFPVGITSEEKIAVQEGWRESSSTSSSITRSESMDDEEEEANGVFFDFFSGTNNDKKVDVNKNDTASKCHAKQNPLSASCVKNFSGNKRSEKHPIRNNLSTSKDLKHIRNYSSKKMVLSPNTSDTKAPKHHRTIRNNNEIKTESLNRGSENLFPKADKDSLEEKMDRNDVDHTLGGKKKKVQINRTNELTAIAMTKDIYDSVSTKVESNFEWGCSDEEEDMYDHSSTAANNKFKDLSNNFSASTVQKDFSGNFRFAGKEDADVTTNDFFKDASFKRGKVLCDRSNNQTVIANAKIKNISYLKKKERTKKNARVDNSFTKHQFSGRKVDSSRYHTNEFEAFHTTNELETITMSKGVMSIDSINNENAVIDCANELVANSMSDKSKNFFDLPFKNKGFDPFNETRTTHLPENMKIPTLEDDRKHIVAKYEKKKNKGLPEEDQMFNFSSFNEMNQFDPFNEAFNESRNGESEFRSLGKELRENIAPKYEKKKTEVFSGDESFHFNPFQSNNENQKSSNEYQEDSSLNFGSKFGCGDDGMSFQKGIENQASLENFDKIANKYNTKIKNMDIDMRKYDKWNKKKSKEKNVTEDISSLIKETPKPAFSHFLEDSDTRFSNSKREERVPKNEVDLFSSIPTNNKLKTNSSDIFAFNTKAAKEVKLGDDQVGFQTNDSLFQNFGWDEQENYNVTKKIENGKHDFFKVLDENKNRKEKIKEKSQNKSLLQIKISSPKAKNHNTFSNKIGSWGNVDRDHDNSQFNELDEVLSNKLTTTQCKKDLCVVTKCESVEELLSATIEKEKYSDSRNNNDVSRDRIASTIMKQANDGFKMPSSNNISKRLHTSSSKEELVSRKRILKSKLKLFDMEFAHNHGRKPSKKEKEGIAGLFQEYIKIKARLSALEKGKIQSPRTCPSPKTPNMSKHLKGLEPKFLEW